MTIFENRLEPANQVMELLGLKTAQLLISEGKLFFRWKSEKGLLVTRRARLSQYRNKFCFSFPFDKEVEELVGCLVRWIDDRTSERWDICCTCGNVGFWEYRIESMGEVSEVQSREILKVLSNAGYPQGSLQTI